MVYIGYKTRKIMGIKNVVSKRLEKENTEGLDVHQF